MLLRHFCQKRQLCRSNRQQGCQLHRQCRTSFALKVRPFEKVECCFDKVERCFDIVAGVDRALVCNGCDCCRTEKKTEEVTSRSLLLWTYFAQYQIMIILSCDSVCVSAVYTLVLSIYDKPVLSQNGCIDRAGI